MIATVLLMIAVHQTPQNPAPALQSGREPFDSTVAYVSEVAVRVAEVRSGIDRYRRAVFNEADAGVLAKADLLRRSCQALTEITAQAPRRMCRDCMTAAARPSFTSYRTGMTRLGATGRQCSATVARLSRGRQAVAAAGLRREVENVSNRLVTGLQDYEARLTAVRRALGWTGESPVEARRRLGLPQRRP